MIILRITSFLERYKSDTRDNSNFFKKIYFLKLQLFKKTSYMMF